MLAPRLDSSAATRLPFFCVCRFIFRRCAAADFLPALCSLVQMSIPAHVLQLFALALNLLSPCVYFEFSITCGLLQVEAGLILSYRIKKLEVSEFLSFSRGGSPNTPTRCSVKCL
jgi:hypothetical protein